ncbi:glycosyltransferase family A protein [Dyadobacter sp. CY312]|uniref:glycosyltransferase family 2 protein n=1 Tax=Dyadobacter sp. CY312 TaxID=2907303 RepID=UPI001F375234|nr:glycosyltransferase family A protein [Dyadobacter sp. CY312]MCE7041480.1 glycosyltransferase family 2 protein [Dyadobacter sp. CY312]
MSLFGLPEWVRSHLYEHKNYTDLSFTEIESIKKRISIFKNPDPEVSIVIPVWNEQDSIFRTLSSLSANITDYKVELIVINNNSSDKSQEVLDELGVISYFQPDQGIHYARQMGLEKAKGTYHLCADADTVYPPKWIDLMVAPMRNNEGVTGVHGRYSFIPPNGNGRFGLWFYELLTAGIIRIRQRKRQYLNVYGFNMGLITRIGLETGGFKTITKRQYANMVGSDFVNDSEDGRMARNLLTRGRIALVTDSKARVFTSARRLMDDGSILKAFMNRVKVQLRIFREFT